MEIKWPDSSSRRQEISCSSSRFDGVFASLRGDVVFRVQREICQKNTTSGQRCDRSRAVASRYLSWWGSLDFKGKLSFPPEAFHWISNWSIENPLQGILSYWRRDGMNIDEAVEVIIVSENYSVEKWIVERCVDQFVSQTDKKWVQLQKHKRFSELEPATFKHITEERVDYLERILNIGVTCQFEECTPTRKSFPKCHRCESVDDIRNNFRV